MNEAIFSWILANSCLSRGVVDTSKYWVHTTRASYQFLLNTSTKYRQAARSSYFVNLTIFIHRHGRKCSFNTTITCTSFYCIAHKHKQLHLQHFNQRGINFYPKQTFRNSNFCCTVCELQLLAQVQVACTGRSLAYDWHTGIALEMICSAHRYLRIFHI